MGKYSKFCDDYLLDNSFNETVMMSVDLHNTNGNSNKFYTIFITQRDGNYHMQALYGRVGNTGQRVGLGAHSSLAGAIAMADKQKNVKKRGGYVEVFTYSNDKAKASATGVLAEEVLEVLHKRYPRYATLKSPTGAKAIIIRVNDNGSLQVQKEEDSSLITIPFGQYGAFEVVT